MKMNLDQTVKLANLTNDQIERVYSGRPGCGCGCKGSYSENKGQKTRVLNALKSRISEVEYTEGFKGEAIFSLEDETRYRWVYVK